MMVFMAGLCIMLGGGVISRLVPGNPRFGVAVGVLTAVLGALAGLLGAVDVLASQVVIEWTSAWPLPAGEFAVRMDALSAVFLCVIFGLAMVSAIYGWDYLRVEHAQTVRGRRTWLWFNLLVVSMSLVVVARHAVLFLLAWEVMSVSSFLLVAYDHEREDVSRAAWIYLVATQIGSAMLLAMFAVVGARMGSFDFSAWGALRNADPGFRGAVFMLGLVGFGVKAGLYPIHVWLPEAHPAAPSHVSALMSGVMIKTGIYAVIRLLSLLGSPDPWWGLLLVAIGVASGVLGVVFALAQHDIKRLLAYSSVENIGIIVMGLGLGMLGWSYRQPVVMVAGLAGALLHVVNHSVFKGLLFMAAGSVVHATGCRDINRMGGLMRRMPHTGAAFLAGSAAISGLPPFNGFLSEFLIYSAAFIAVLNGPSTLVAPAVVVIGALALIGGLATACFSKVFGVAFLGEPRNDQAAHAHECGMPMRISLYALSAGCLVIVGCAAWIIPGLFRVAGTVAGLPVDPGTGPLAMLGSVVSRVSGVSAVLIVLGLLLAVVRWRLLNGRCVGRAVTWDCGYAAPTVRMQYTASSYTQPITSLFRAILGFRIRLRPPTGLFPAAASYESRAGDTANDYLFRPFFRFVERMFIRLRWLQAGHVQVYVLYVALALLILLLVAL